MKNVISSISNGLMTVSYDANSNVSAYELIKDDTVKNSIQEDY